jgi:hypothetical protein
MQLRQSRGGTLQCAAALDRNGAALAEPRQIAATCSSMQQNGAAPYQTLALGLCCFAGNGGGESRMAKDGDG